VGLATPPSRADAPRAGLAPEEYRSIDRELKAVTTELAALRKDTPNKPAYSDLLADVEIFPKGVEWALRYEANLAPTDILLIKKALRRARRRADALAGGHMNHDNQPSYGRVPMPLSRLFSIVRSARQAVGIALCGAMLVLIPGCHQGTHKPPVQVTENDFDRVVLDSKLPVLVDFSASWCGPCQDMEPVLGELMVELEGKAKIVQVDIDKAPELARRYGASAIPHFVVFKKGKAVAAETGKLSKMTLTAMLDLPR
jgi:thioredoxin